MIINSDQLSDDQITPPASSTKTAHYYKAQVKLGLDVSFQCCGDGIDVRCF